MNFDMFFWQASKFTALLTKCLREKCSQLPPELRMALVKALMTMRNRGVAGEIVDLATVENARFAADPLQTLELCFELVKCEDKELRYDASEHVARHIVVHRQ